MNLNHSWEIGLSWRKKKEVFGTRSFNVWMVRKRYVLLLIIRSNFSVVFQELYVRIVFGEHVLEPVANLGPLPMSFSFHEFLRNDIQ